MHFTIATVVAVLPFLVAASPVSNTSKGVVIPINKRVNNSAGAVNAAALRAQRARLQGKYDRTLATFEKNTGKAHSLAKVRGIHVAKRDTGSEDLTDAQEELWYGSIDVGTPAVSFTIDFDTGSSDLFVPSADCNSCGSHASYDPSASSTSNDVGQTFTLRYGDGSTTSGEQYTDTVTVAGLTAQDQTLGSATSYSQSFKEGPMDGLMGLAFPEISSYGATPFFNTLIENGAVDKGVFSFKLASSGSELFLGGTDSSQYSGGINWNSVTEKGYWQIDLGSANVNGRVAVSRLSSIIDSGTTLIVGDDENVRAFYNAVSGSADASNTVGEGFYTFPCGSVPGVSLTFNGKSYPISASNFNLGAVSEGSSECVGGIVSGNEGFWIVGDTFMKNVYTVFDFDNTRVGFAELA